MKVPNIIPALAILLILSSCQQSNEYNITVTVTDGPDSLMVHNNWYTSSDTLLLLDGTCTFTGVIDTFPKLVSLGFPYPSQERTRIILEPGDIDITYSKDGGYKLGGTKNNIILQELFDELKPLEKEVKAAWKLWSNTYKEEPRSKGKCEAAWIIQEKVKKRKTELTRKLIKENPNYAGLVITLPLVRTENAENLDFYVKHFKEFALDKRYQSIVKQYEIADKTTNGKPVPGFSYPNPDGALVSLSDFKGKWVLLDFWYVDCPWCRKLTPHLINIYDEWKDSKNFEIISVSVDKPKNYERWLEAIEHDGAIWTQVNDSTKTYPLEYGITGYPTLILIDPEGNGVRKIVGYQEEGGMRRILEEYIK
ncbi:MAG: AhpC/TSA family protein [Bacteroidales bacterium]|nr:AhpC/TSA family protein [Bacteroidales bacterium]